MDKNWYKNHWTYIIALIVIVLVYVIIPKAPAGDYDVFAQCLTDSGAVMYGTDWCPHCKNQKALFGDSFSKVEYVNCDYNTDECNANGVQGYPTWKINGENYPGTQSLAKLASVSGCEL